MSGELGHIRQYLNRLTRWERVLVALSMLAQGAGWLGGVGLWMVLAAWLRLPALTAWLCLVGLLLAGVAFLLWRAGSRWRVTSDLQRQALLVESCVPDLRGACVTVATRLNGPVGQESEAILHRVAQRAAKATRGLDVRRVHPLTPLRPVVLRGCGVWGAAILLGCLNPGVQGVWSFWGGVNSATAAVENVGPSGAGETLRVGDILLRYVYPPYTGLEPLDVANATGDIEAPAGTRVEVALRTASVIEGATLVAYGDTLEASVDEEGRTVETRVTVREDAGAYQLIMRQGGQPRSSAQFAITPMPDLPPEVTVDIEAPLLEVRLHDPIEVPWSARDDYGVARVALEVDGRESWNLHVQEGRAAEASGRQVRTPSELGLAAGDEARLVVVAWDNDTWSGSKAGRSRAVRVQVVGGEGERVRNLEDHRSLMEEMLPVLARVLTSPLPEERREREWAAWGERLSLHYGPLFEHAASADGPPGGLTDLLLQRVLESAQDVIRYSQVAFEPSSQERPSEASVAMAQEMYDRSVQVLEDAILSLDRALRARARKLLAKHADRLDSLAMDLDRLLRSEALDAQAMRTRTDQGYAALDELDRLSTDLGAGGLRTFVEARSAAVRGILDEANKALDSEEQTRATTLMERTGTQMRELAQGIRRNLEAGQQREDEIGQQAQSLVEAIRELEEQQRTLMEQVQGVRAREDAELTSAFVRLWERAEREVDAVVTQGERWRDALGVSQRPFYEVQRAESAIEQSRRLQAAVHARDLVGAVSELLSSQYGWDLVVQTAMNEASRGATEPPLSEAQQVVWRQLRVQQTLAELERASLRSDPEVRGAVVSLEAPQRALVQELTSLQGEVRKVIEQYPVRPDGLEENVDAAMHRMGDARASLGEGRALEAEGAQGMTLGHLKRAREALEQAMRQAARESAEGSGSRGQGQDQEGAGRGGDEIARPDQEMGIPTREDFQSPEAYRDALLRGMEGEVPAQYRALKKRYFEELVHQ